MNRSVSREGLISKDAALIRDERRESLRDEPEAEIDGMDGTPARISVASHTALRSVSFGSRDGVDRDERSESLHAREAAIGVEEKRAVAEEIVVGEYAHEIKRLYFMKRLYCSAATVSSGVLVAVASLGGLTSVFSTSLIVSRVAGAVSIVSALLGGLGIWFEKQHEKARNELAQRLPHGPDGP